MQKKTMKIAALAVMAGTLLQFGGCLGGLIQEAALRVVGSQVAALVPDLGLGNLLGG